MSERCDVTVLTYDRYPALHDDDRLFAQALRGRGASVRAAVWDDPSVDWSASPVAVFRSTWNYFEHPQAFTAWLDRAQRLTRLVNAAETVRWNADKSYLLELQARGVPVIPSEIVAAAHPRPIGDLCRERSWGDVVVKPAISGASFRTQRFSAGGDAAQAHASALLAGGRDVLVQPYLPQVEREGEYALIYFGDVFSHAVRKLPFNGVPPDGLEAPVDVPAPWKALAESILRCLPELPAYARVDLVPGGDGPLLMELELIEPTLFFRARPESAGLLAERVLAATP